MFPAVVPQTTVSAFEVPPAAEFHLSRQLGNHAPRPTPPLGLWVLRGPLHPRAQWRRSVLLHAASGSLTAVLIRSAVDPSPIAKELTPAGQPSGRRFEYSRLHLRRRLMGPQYRRHAQLQLYGTLPQPATRPLKTHSTAVRAIPLSVCHQEPPSGNRTGLKKVRTRSSLFSLQL